MGKKSRQKRERRIAREATNRNFLSPQIHSLQAKAEMVFQEHLKLTRDLLSQYIRTDAALALTVLDLWPGNAGSPIKHIFAWGVLLNLEPNQADTTPIESYAAFQAFASSIFSVWPEFPMLEDFAPEADWGQTKIRLGADFVPMFYGGCIERTPDFIEAFRITYADQPAALAHMDLAVAVQTGIIEAIPHLRTTPIPDTKCKHVEIPPEDFWGVCRAALLHTGSNIADWRQKAGTVLETSFGAFRAPSTVNAFGDAVMQGMALPFLAVVEGKAWIPMSVRSGPGVVIDHWATQPPQTVSLRVHQKLARFVMERFRQTFPGPLRLVIGGVVCKDILISCVISADSGVYLICACDHTSNSRIARAAKEAYNKLKRGAPLHFLLTDGRPLMLSEDGVTGPSADELHILIVVTQSSTTFGTINTPEKPARLLPLADFVTIFDSLSDLAELERYWEYVDEQQASFNPFTSPSDLFASFRDSHGVLVEGAMSPTWIALATNWGTSWRFRELANFWFRAPLVFPDGSSGWLLSDGTQGVVQLKSRHHKALAYSTTVGSCTAQTQTIITPGVAIEDAKMVDLFAQLLADCLQQCHELISDAPLFRLPHLLFSCEPELGSVIDPDQFPEPLEKFPRVVISVLQASSMGRLRLKLDVRAVMAGLNEATDASFEIRCLRETLNACHAIYGMDMPPEIEERLQTKVFDLARYHLKVANRYVDVPDYVSPIIPSPAEYKLARKQLATSIKDLGLSPGRYELAEAKARIDPAISHLRLHIEKRIASLDKYQLLRACIEQHDALLIAERLKIQRARQSLSHAVEYDRLEAVGNARKEFGPTARHYRYLLEKVASSPVTGINSADDRILRELVGLVDWYTVLTGASDILHNAIDVGGVDIDDSFIPDVFYSSDWDQREELFSREDAKFRLGIDINNQDAVEGASADLLSSNKLRQAFTADLGFELQHLLNALGVLSQAKRHGFSEDLSLSYSTEPNRLSQVLVENIAGLQIAEANKIVEFLTLSEDGIVRLAKRDVDEIDVPYWEHSKRVHRYAIRPLVTDGAELRWGAEQASRTMNIWISSVRDGYLPADFDWPNIAPVIREIKEGIEKQLEFRTEEIFKRHTPYVVRGMDFFRKFRRDNFDDVGDFDTLAYWPETNLLVIVECKYNQPRYTVKDSRRLRDEIFGKDENDRNGQFSRIFRRRQFAKTNRARMLELLKWPIAENNFQQDMELYVSRDMHYWMVHPPYPVPTKFVRVDALDSWIKQALIEKKQDGHTDNKLHK